MGSLFFEQELVERIFFGSGSSGLGTNQPLMTRLAPLHKLQPR